MKTYRVMYTENGQREESTEFTRKTDAMKFAKNRRKEGCTTIFIDIYEQYEDYEFEQNWVNSITI